MSYSLEVIAFNIESCKIAEHAGVHRIELCDNPGDGGTTPSMGFIRQARKNVSIELFPIIRPRGGDFLYTPDEFEIMLNDVKLCKEIGCDGIVSGILNADGTVDTERTAKLTELAYPMSVTFHRAFDRTLDPFEALEKIIDSGCERILTSGQQPTAMEGAGLIKSLIEKADNRIIIMPGSGVRSGNIKELIQLTGAREIHTSARKTEKSKMIYINELMHENLQSTTLDITEVKSMINALYSIS